MDMEKLKSKIREALGAAGIPREVAAQVESIIDQMGGKKDEPGPAAQSQAAPPPRTHREAPKHKDDEDEDEDKPHLASAKMAVKPARKTKTVRKKK